MAKRGQWKRGDVVERYFGDKPKMRFEVLDNGAYSSGLWRYKVRWKDGTIGTATIIYPTVNDAVVKGV